MIYVVLSLVLFPFLYMIASLKGTPAGKRIVVFQTAKIGDMVCSTPVFREIKKKYPEAFLSVMADPASRPVLDNNPHIDEIIPVRGIDMKGFIGKFRIADRLRKGNFDISVSLQPNVANNVVPLWALIKKRYSIYPNFHGSTFKCSSILNTLNVPHVLEQSIVDTYLKLLNRSMGVHLTKDSSKLELHPSDMAKNKAADFLGKKNLQNAKLVGIAPAARNKLKELAPRIFADIADRVQEHFNSKVVLIGSEGDRQVIDDVKKHMRTAPVDSCGIFALAELPAILQRLSLFISVDSGPVYIAEAMGVPIINIAGPCAMNERPLGDKAAVVQNKLECVPCSYTFSTAVECKRGDRQCIASVSADEVIETAKVFLS